MKKKSDSQSAFFNLRVLFGLFIALAGVFLALVGAGAFSRASAQDSSQNPGVQVTPSYHNETWPRLRKFPLSPKTPLTVTSPAWASMPTPTSSRCECDGPATLSRIQPIPRFSRLKVQLSDWRTYHVSPRPLEQPIQRGSRQYAR